MSVSDPLIRDIKGHTLKLLEEVRDTPELTDQSPGLVPFCTSLEKIFHKGLIESYKNSYYINRKCEVYGWMVKIGDEQENLAYRASLEKTKGFRNIRGPLGRFRQLVRCCLMKKCLQAPVEYLINSGKASKYYQTNSILGDEILSKILLSVLQQCGKISFTLDLDNASFLDHSWQLPEVLKLELVPCSSLGMAVSYSDNKAVIVTIKPNGVASEYQNIKKGDVLDNLNGVYIDSSTKGHLNAIFRANKGRPVQIVIVKAFDVKSLSFFPPIRKLLDNLQLDIDEIRRLNSTKADDAVTKTMGTRPGFAATYLGSVSTGNKGNTKQVEWAINSLLSNPKKKASIPVSFEIGEINVKIMNIETNEEFMRHSYMQISSCGSVPLQPTYIAYIAGSENCDTAAEFVAYIFHIANLEDACTILQSIGQGFHRTHFAV